MSLESNLNYEELEELTCPQRPRVHSDILDANLEQLSRPRIRPPDWKCFPAIPDCK